MDQDWREYTGAAEYRQYLENQNLVVIPATKYEQAELKEELAENWDLVADCIINGTWQAIYAESEEELAEILSEMTEEAVAHGYEDCMNFCAEEAKKRYLLEEGVRNE